LASSAEELRLTQLACQLTAEKNSAVAEQQQQSEELAELRTKMAELQRQLQVQQELQQKAATAEESEVDQEEASDAVDESDGEAALLSDDSGSKRLLLPRLATSADEVDNQSDDDGELCEQFRELSEAELDQMIQEAESALKDRACAARTRRGRRLNQAELAALLTRLEIAEQNTDEEQLLTACGDEAAAEAAAEAGGAQMDTGGNGGTAGEESDLEFDYTELNTTELDDLLELRSWKLANILARSAYASRRFWRLCANLKRLRNGRHI
uniref:MFAP1 domain-containing protein n=1 Tax=Macrostomum lignano TaxID=282301 RepID=A0A1I8FPE7_9PLAT